MYENAVAAIMNGDIEAMNRYDCDYLASEKDRLEKELKEKDKLIEDLRNVKEGQQAMIQMQVQTPPLFEADTTNELSILTETKKRAEHNARIEDDKEESSPLAKRLKTSSNDPGTTLTVSNNNASPIEASASPFCMACRIKWDMQRSMLKYGIKSAEDANNRLAGELADAQKTNIALRNKSPDQMTVKLKEDVAALEEELEAEKMKVAKLNAELKVSTEGISIVKESESKLTAVKTENEKLQKDLNISTDELVELKNANTYLLKQLDLKTNKTSELIMENARLKSANVAGSSESSLEYQQVKAENVELCQNVTKLEAELEASKKSKADIATRMHQLSRQNKAQITGLEAALATSAMQCVAAVAHAQQEGNAIKDVLITKVAKLDGELQASRKEATALKKLKTETARLIQQYTAKVAGLEAALQSSQMSQRLELDRQRSDNERLEAMKNAVVYKNREEHGLASTGQGMKESTSTREVFANDLDSLGWCVVAVANSMYASGITFTGLSLAQKIQHTLVTVQTTITQMETEIGLLSGDVDELRKRFGVKDIECWIHMIDGIANSHYTGSLHLDAAYIQQYLKHIHTMSQNVKEALHLYWAFKKSLPATSST
jgi:hypothetical protein